MIGKQMNVRRYCKSPELIENYDLAIADKKHKWWVHHRKENMYTSSELKDMGMYYDRPPEELIFLTREMHDATYHKGKDKDAWNKGKQGIYSEETLEKISAAHSVPVICIETGQIYESAKAASKALNLANCAVSSTIRGHQKTAGGYHWKRLMDN